MPTAAASSIPDDRNWLTEPPEAMPAIIAEKFKGYHEGLARLGLIETWKRALRLHYGRDPSGSYASSHGVSFGGEQGESAALRSNHFRSLARRFLAMATADRPAPEVSASSDSSDAPGQCSLARALLEASLVDGGLEEQAHNAAEMTFPFGEGYVWQPWDPTAGEVVRTEEVAEVGDGGEPVLDDTGAPRMKTRPVMSGDILVEAFTPIDVARDLEQPARAQPSWLIVRRWRNRWDLIAEYPEKREALLAVTSDEGATKGIWSARQRTSKDWLPCFTLYAEQRPATPNGRVIEVVGDVFLTDGPMPYETIPLHRIRPASEMDGDTAYSDFWDLMGLSDAYDSIVSAMVSAHNIAGMPNLLAAEGQDVQARMMVGGGRVLEHKADGRSPPPAWLPPPPIGEGNLQLREIVREDLEINSGMNSVARGAPTSDTKAASSQALVASFATQYASAFTRALANLYRALFNSRIKIWQRFQTEERTIEIAGSDSRVVRKFKGEDIAGVRSVFVEVAPAIMRTSEGKMMLADRLLDAYGPEVIPPEKYMVAFATGRYEPLYKRQVGQVALIRAENEAIARGEPVEPLITDNHYRHIQEVLTLLDDPEVRSNPERRVVPIQHATQHAALYDELRNTDPALFAMTQEPLPEAMMQMIAMLAPQAAPAAGGEPPPGEEPMPPEEEGAPPAVRASVPGGDMGDEAPLMPPNPLTGERVDPNAPASNAPAVMQ